MRKIAIYGKGGIGKSTTCANIAVALAERGLKVMQIGCDPKADSTYALRHGEQLATVLDTFRAKGNAFELDEVVKIGYADAVCVEAGGPVPGVGCAGRGIITALEKIEAKGIYDEYEPDVIIYDVLGDVVCGGFSMPMRDGYAEEVYVMTSGENMAIYAAANIALAIENFKDRDYAKLGGIILNKRDVRNEDAKVQELAEDLKTEIIGVIPRNEIVTDAEEMKMTVLEAFPESDQAEEYRKLARTIIGE